MPGLNWRDVAAIRVTKVVDDAGRLGASGTIKDMPFPAELFGGGAVWVGGGGMALRWDGDAPVNPTTFPNTRVVPVPIRVATPSARSLQLLEGAVVGEVAIP